jgi:dTDP-4-dehydrorhamnose 3,5-epimerase
MEFLPTKFDGAWRIVPKVHRDIRGFFIESYSEKIFRDHGITQPFVQDNHSKSVEQGVLRGLHFQLPPFAQAKLVRVIAGKLLDVVVDLRKSSPTFGQWESFELDAENFWMLYVPRGFAHGFCTLEPDTEMVYKVDNYYSAQHDSGLVWNDPDLRIAWPVTDPVLSDKDSHLGAFNKFTSPF